MNTVLLVVLVIVGILILRFIFKSLKTLLVLGLVAVVILGGLWYFKPEVLNEYFGTENVAAVETVVKKNAEKANQKAKELGKEAGDKIKEQIEE